MCIEEQVMVTERLTVSIAGMTCAGCATRIEKALRDREGVVGAQVNLTAQEAVVTYYPYTVEPRQLTEVVEHLGYVVPRWTARQLKEQTAPARAQPEPESQLISAALWEPALAPLAGLAASVLLVGLYLGLVTVAQDWKHATELLWGDRWLVAAIAVGFGVQIGLYVHLRRLNRLHHQLGHCKALTASGTGGSSVAMVACCAHHLTEVLPIVGFSAAATFLNRYRVPFMLVGIGTNLVGITFMLRLIRRQAPLASRLTPAWRYTMQQFPFRMSRHMLIMAKPGLQKNDSQET
jgi:cation transport ATPase